MNFEETIPSKSGMPCDEGGSKREETIGAIANLVAEPNQTLILFTESSPLSARY